MRLSKLIVTGLASLAIAPSAWGVIIASEEFAYSTGPLAGNAGGSGWTSAWSALPTATVVNPAIDLSGDRALDLTGSAVVQASRTFTPQTSDLYVSFLVQMPSPSSLTLNDFASLWLDTAGGSGVNRPNLGIKADSGATSGPTTGNDVFGRLNGTSNTWIPGSNLAVDTTYHIVGRLYKTASIYSRFDLWLNPTMSDFATPDATAVGNSGISSVSTLGFRTGFNSSGDRVLFDRIILGTTFADAFPASAVPEPGVLALLGISLLGWAATRRRRRR